MSKENMIPADEFCTRHNIEISFLNSVRQAGLIEITTIREAEYIHENQLNQLEKIVRFYYDLDINLEGIETVFQLLDRISELQEEVNELKNRLRFYEGFEFP